MADDLGYGEVGAYGQWVIKTPNIDRMAREGMRFTQFYAGATVCAPSRSVLMTGHHHGRTRVRGNAGAANPAAQALRPGDITVARALQNAGYATALVGKWGLGDVGAAETGLPRRHGFDYFFGYLNTLVVFTSDNGPHNESSHNLDRFTPSGPFSGIKRSLTDGGIRVPTIARWPGTVKAGTTTGNDRQARCVSANRAQRVTRVAADLVAEGGVREARVMCGPGCAIAEFATARLTVPIGRRRYSLKAGGLSMKLTISTTATVRGAPLARGGCTRHAPTASMAAFARASGPPSDRASWNAPW